MSKEIKRYTIVIRDIPETRKITHDNYVEELTDKIKKYNDEKSNEYFVDDFIVDNYAKTVTFMKYKKIKKKYKKDKKDSWTLEEIDNYTTGLKNEPRVKDSLDVDVSNPRPLQIAYRVNNKVRTMDITYNEEILNKSHIADEFTEYGRDINFISRVLSNKHIEASARKSIDDFDQLYVLRDKLRYTSPELVFVAPMRRFYNSYVYENGKFNYLHYRQLALLLLNYKDELSKRNAEKEREQKLETQANETVEREEVFGQMMMEEFAMQELREYYEDLKMAVTGFESFDEVYQHRLIPKKNKNRK